MTDHRADAERELEAAAETFTDPDSDLAAIAQALIGIGHALLAGPPDVQHVLRDEDGQFTTAIHHQVPPLSPSED